MGERPGGPAAVRPGFDWLGCVPGTCHGACRARGVALERRVRPRAKYPAVDCRHVPRHPPQFGGAAGRRSERAQGRTGSRRAAHRHRRAPLAQRPGGHDGRRTRAGRAVGEVLTLCAYNAAAERDWRDARQFVPGNPANHGTGQRYRNQFLIRSAAERAGRALAARDRADCGSRARVH